MSFALLDEVSARPAQGLCPPTARLPYRVASLFRGRSTKRPPRGGAGRALAGAAGLATRFDRAFTASDGTATHIPDLVSASASARAAPNLNPGVRK